MNEIEESDLLGNVIIISSEDRDTAAMFGRAADDTIAITMNGAQINLSQEEWDAVKSKVDPPPPALADPAMHHTVNGDHLADGPDCHCDEPPAPVGVPIVSEEPAWLRDWLAT